jgi:murein L,D-transpeptidase YafK
MLLLLACIPSSATTTSEPTEPAEPVEPVEAPPAPSPCPASTAELAAAYPDRLDAEDPRLLLPDLVVVRKAARRVMLYDRGTLASSACWRVGLGFAPEGHKLVQGDGRTPEGFYQTSDKPWSQFYGAIAVHYPGAEDAEVGHAAGRISATTKRGILSSLAAGEKPDQNTALGGEILLHGGGYFSDWTLGCVAMDDDELDILRAALPRGMKTTILILP